MPVSPIAENGGLSDPDLGNSAGCMGYFGYINGNPGDVDIPSGGANYLTAGAYYVYTSDPYYMDGLPSRFYPGRFSGIVQVKWEGGSPITWVINGQSATLNWCR